MPKKPITDGGKKEEILSAALELFLENGYEKTSIRMISQKIGCEVGLVYYYFKTKDDVFENALALYYAQTETELQKLEDMQTITEDLAEYLAEKANKFRENFANVHFTVRTAICEKITALTEAHLKKMLEKTGKKDTGVAAAFIASGLCRATFGETDFYETNKELILQTAKKLISDEKETSGKKREIPSFLL